MVNMKLMETLHWISKTFERKIVINFLPINLNMCFGAQKKRLIETFFKHPQHIVTLRNKKIIFLLRTLN